MKWHLVEIQEADGQAKPRTEIALVIAGDVPECRVEVGFDVWRRELKLDVLEQFVFRSILELELVTISEIVDLLGLPHRRYIEPVLERARMLGFLRQEGEHIRAQPELREVMARHHWVTKTDETEVMWYNALGFWSLSQPSDSMAGWEAGEQHKPSLEMVLSRLTMQRGGEWVADRQVRSIQASWSGCRSIRVLVCADREERSWWFEVFDGKTWKAIEGGQEGLQLIGELDKIERLVESELESVASVPDTAGEKPTIASELVAEKGRVLGTAEIRPETIRQIRKAKREILMVFPWVDRRVLAGDLIEALDGAVKRGVRVIIAHGMADSIEKEERIDRHALNDLEAVSHDNNRIHVVWLGNSHIKLSLFDRKTLMIGSYNLLSFRGRPSAETGKLRLEMMMVTRVLLDEQTQLAELIVRIEKAVAATEDQ
ncbi:hypothetical protein KQI52_06635 [bacterium]|nr:hypothetical protein [bacterium]